MKATRTNLNWNYYGIIVCTIFISHFSRTVLCTETDDGRPKKNRDQTISNNSPVSPSKIILSNSVECAEDIQQLCGKGLNNYAVLECIQNRKRIEDDDLSADCHNLLWNYRRNLTMHGQYLQAADQICQTEMQKLSSLDECKLHVDKSPELLSCIVENRDKVENQVCKRFLTRTASVIFSDYRLIANFDTACKKDIDQLQCGRIAPTNMTPHSQGKTVECLSQYIDKLSPECRHETFRVAELQSDDFNLDRPLFFACREDRERFCEKVPSGEGKVYRCLMKHKFEPDMSTECRTQLLRRQKLIMKDYKVSRGFSKTCRIDIQENNCKQRNNDKEVRLALVLLCLENAIKTGKAVSRDCQIEMLDHRKSLMSDYQLSPELVAVCSESITKFCESLQGGGKTIHCLMEHARSRKRSKRITDRCMRAIEGLIQEADAGEDWRVDPVLHESCQSVVDASCKDVTGGEARVMSCLMEKLGSRVMTQTCESALLQIQYFVSRNFKLDPQLFSKCHDNAVKLCHAKDDWADNPNELNPERGPMIMPCLYRYAYHPQVDLRLDVGCLQEVRRVMRERTFSIDLQPEIEEPCMEDLGKFCSDRTGKGEEMICLQDHLEKLETDCKNVVSNFTEDEAENAELNPIIMTYCKEIMEEHCEDELKEDKDEGDIMECLIENKNEPSVREKYKCRAAIEHFQLISLKDYHFSYKFKQNCKKEVTWHCPHVKSKSAVVYCLSEIVRNDTINEHRHQISRECRHQLKAQLLRQRENIQFDPQLKSACDSDINKLCADKESNGHAEVSECLKKHAKELTDECHKEIFRIEKDEMLDNSIDYVLSTGCKRMIIRYCADEDKTNMLECLKKSKNLPDFEPKCRHIVLQRMIEQNKDYRFNPQLRKACDADIHNFCKSIILFEPKDKEIEGKVINCLKNYFSSTKQHLSPSCSEQLASIIKESALDYRQDPVLADVCFNDIKQLCNAHEENDDTGAVEECLRVALNSGSIRSQKCKEQVIQTIQEAKADIHVDPLLYKACNLDLNHLCKDVIPGEGRQLSCLIEVMDTKLNTLHPECRSMLIKRRKLFAYAAKISLPNNIEDLYKQVTKSPSRNFFAMVIITFIGIIFIMGLFCGRITKRMRAELKNK